MTNKFMDRIKQLEVRSPKMKEKTNAIVYALAHETAQEAIQEHLRGNPDITPEEYYVVRRNSDAFTTEKYDANMQIVTGDNSGHSFQLTDADYDALARAHELGMLKRERPHD